MSKTTFKLNLAGVNKLMKSPEMQAVLNGAASRIASAAGDGYEVEKAHPISFVAIASVWADTRESYRDCLENNTLLKAVGGVKI